MKAERTYFEKLDVYKLAETLSNEIWTVTKGWDYFSRDTVGRQLVRAADSVGANIAEEPVGVALLTTAVPCTKHDIG
jgi:23S rRNA-intervening sequence protein